MKYNNTVVKKMNFNGQKVKKWYHNGVKVFSSGNIVTYNVDTGTSYQEEVDSEATVLSPKTFTPTKSGWTFVGWRTDKTASSSVIQSMTMGDDPITLYAVFKRTLTTTFSGNGATSGSVSAIYATQYYNNGNYNNPVITLPSNGFSRTDYAFTGWNLGAVGAKVTISGNTTVYAQWRQSIVRIIQNSAMCSGVNYTVTFNDSPFQGDQNRFVNGAVLYTQQYHDSDGDSHDSNFHWYWIAKIPYGKTIHCEYVYTVTEGYPDSVVVSFAGKLHDAGNPGSAYDFSSGIDGRADSFSGVKKSISVKNDKWSNGCYLGFHYDGDGYGTGGGRSRLDILNVWYDV